MAAREPTLWLPRGHPFIFLKAFKGLYFFSPFVPGFLSNQYFLSFEKISLFLLSFIKQFFTDQQENPEGWVGSNSFPSTSLHLRVGENSNFWLNQNKFFLSGTLTMSIQVNINFMLRPHDQKYGQVTFRMDRRTSPVRTVWLCNCHCLNFFLSPFVIRKSSGHANIRHIRATRILLPTKRLSSPTWTCLASGLDHRQITNFTISRLMPEPWEPVWFYTVIGDSKILLRQTRIRKWKDDGDGEELDDILRGDM